MVLTLAGVKQNTDASRVRLRADDWGDFSRMPRRLRRLRFTSQKLPPIIRPLPTRASIMGLIAKVSAIGMLPRITAAAQFPG
jgi:hypothetical protein